MRRFLLYLLGFLFLSVVICNFSNIAFAYEDEDSDSQDERNSEKGEDSENSEKERVHSIIDSILKINKHVDPTVRESRLQKLKKERELRRKEQEEQRKKELDESDDDSDEADTEAENSSAEGNKRSSAKIGAKTKDRDDDLETTQSSKESAKSSHERWSKLSPFQAQPYHPFSSRKVFTVKNIKLSPHTTNKYLRNSYNSASNYRTKRYGNRPQKTRLSMEYKIRSYSENRGKNTAITAELPSPYKKFTIKSKDYFGNKSCHSTTGCSSY
jgi:hypothetical protein